MDGYLEYGEVKYSFTKNVTKRDTMKTLARFANDCWDSDGHDGTIRSYVTSHTYRGKVNGQIQDKLQRTFVSLKYTKTRILPIH